MNKPIRICPPPLLGLAGKKFVFSFSAFTPPAPTPAKTWPLGAVTPTIAHQRGVHVEVEDRSATWTGRRLGATLNQGLPAHAARRACPRTSGTKGSPSWPIREPAGATHCVGATRSPSPRSCSKASCRARPSLQPVLRYGAVTSTKGSPQSFRPSRPTAAS